MLSLIVKRSRNLYTESPVSDVDIINHKIWIWM